MARKLQGISYSKLRKEVVFKLLTVVVVAFAMLGVMGALATGAQTSNVLANAQRSFDSEIRPNAENVVRVFLDGAELSFDVPPVIVEGRTLVPMRAIFEAFGAEVDWKHETQTATATKGGREVVITRYLNTAWVDGVETHLDVAARTVDNRMMVPLRFVSETLGMQVQWTEREQRIDLFTASSIDARLSFGLQPPQPIYFQSRNTFVDMVPTIYYNLVLSFDNPNSWSNRPLTIRTIVWKPNGSMLMDYVGNPIEISSGAREFRHYGRIQYPGSERNQPGVANPVHWDLGEYRVEVWLDGERTAANTFTVVPAINDQGNTSANMFNSGLVARQADRFYVVGANGSLYKGEVGRTEVEQLTTDRANYINVQGQWIYFINLSKDQVISRIRFDGRNDTNASNPHLIRRGEAETISHDAAEQLLLIDDWLYYVNLSDDRKLYRIRTDGSESQLVLNDSILQYYIHTNPFTQANEIVYIKYEDTYRYYITPEEQRRRQTEDIQPWERREHNVGIGSLYVADLKTDIADMSTNESKKLYNGMVTGMIVEGTYVYFLKPIDNGWNRRVSGRVAGNLYRMELSDTGSQKSNVDSNIYKPEAVAILGDKQVTNFYVDADMLVVQDDLNRGRVWHVYTPDGEYVREIQTNITQQAVDTIGESFYQNRSTFPVTYMNRMDRWMYYYVGDKDDKISDNMPLRTDERLIIVR
ncbi:stalk domain-containing protein [Desulfuribacillus alkaliarsenatis]|uniref:Copper amine oxidase-like N-terminal domain-containing protein n=1 Tax=Desulfuribacillus alkaliarsenatis TaxID=766136 RepID=A0A1E5G1S1_9FIRM|nr:stalk domain-containing protein [Desulfuribacillus alkaliarsenatis]OEF96854.1 hypothetical protein BHF68_07280 [Desulfuribacillus alkaliarsenatis]